MIIVDDGELILSAETIRVTVCLKAQLIFSFSL